MTTHEKPEQSQALTPYLICRGAARAIDFYRTVFGAKELYRLVDPHDKVGHAELILAGSKLMLADEFPDFGALSPMTIGGTPVNLHLYVDDVDAVIASAERRGATVLRPAKDEFFGDRAGMVADPFGHKWHIATRKVEVSPEEMQRRWSEQFR
jgi:PhnB protein